MRLPHAADLPLPAYQSALAAGLDLLAAVPADAPVEIAPGGRAMIPTGIAIALPPGSEGQIRPRSGLAVRHGVTVLNAPGTIDADYRGEIQVILINLGAETFVVRARHAHRAAGDRHRYNMQILLKATKLDATERASGGFGSTGNRTQIAKKCMTKLENASDKSKFN